MGILTAIVGLGMIVIGAGSLGLRRSLLPEINPVEAALATIPFGLVTLFIGLAIGV